MMWKNSDGSELESLVKLAMNVWKNSDGSELESLVKLAMNGVKKQWWIRTWKSRQTSHEWCEKAEQ